MGKREEGLGVGNGRGLKVWKREKGLAVRGGKMGERLGVENGKG